MGQIISDIYEITIIKDDNINDWRRGSENLYKLITAFSLSIRNFILPNPFEQLPVPLSISISGTEVVIPAVVINWLIEPILYRISFMVAGIYYKKGIDNPAKGSFLYLLFYCVHVGLLFVLSGFQFSTLIVVVTIIAYMALHVIVSVIKYKLLFL
jgi:hypothetical protein